MMTSAPAPVDVYNVEVADFHTYFVASAGVWVHNCGGDAVSSRVTGYAVNSDGIRHGLQQAIGRDGGRGVAPWAMVDALNNPARNRYALESVPTTGPVVVERLDRAKAGESGYDVLLRYARGSFSKTAFFVRTQVGYEWIGEQDMHRGPGTYSTADGEAREYIAVTYRVRPIRHLGAERPITYNGPGCVTGCSLTPAEAWRRLRTWPP
jgi:hypothetical protein